MVSLSSIGHQAGGMRWHDLHWTSGYAKWWAVSAELTGIDVAGPAA